MRRLVLMGIIAIGLFGCAPTQEPILPPSSSSLTERARAVSSGDGYTPQGLNIIAEELDGIRLELKRLNDNLEKQQAADQSNFGSSCDNGYI